MQMLSNSAHFHEQSVLVPFIERAGSGRGEETVRPVRQTTWTPESKAENSGNLPRIIHT